MAGEWEDVASSEWEDVSPKDVLRGMVASHTRGGSVPKQRTWKDTARDVVKFVRPTVEGGSAVVGGIVGGGGGLLVGAPTGPGAVATTGAGALLGSGLGYAGAKNVLDGLDELLGGESGGTLTDRFARSAYDTALGSTYEAGGQAVAPLVGGALRLAKAAPRTVVAPAETASKVWNDAAKRAAQKRIAAAVTKEGPIAARTQVNRSEYEALKQAIPDVTLTPAQVTDDAATIKLQQQLQNHADGAPALFEGQTLNNRRAAEQYLNGSLPDGSLDDLLTALNTESAARSGRVASQTDVLGQASKEAASARMRELELAAQRGLKAQADDLYSQVDRSMELDSSPLYNTLKELGDSVDPAFANPKNMPSGMINRAKSALMPEEGLAPQFDYKDIYNQLTNNQGFSRGKTGKGFFTDSDFSRQLAEYFPSVKGYPKNEILGALQDGINGGKLSPFRQGILDDMSYDLAAKGSPATTKAQQQALNDFLPSDPEKMTYGQLMQYNEQVTSALRLAKERGQFAQAYNLGKIKDGIQQTLRLAESGDADALRRANSFYRDTYVPTVRQGQTAKNLATDRTGGFRVDDEISAGKYLQAGDKGLATANDFNRLFGQDQAARSALTDYASRDLFDAATANGTQAPDLKAAQKWVADRMPAMRKLGLENQFDGFLTALKQEADISDFQAALGKDPQEVLSSLMTARGSKDIVRSTLDLKTLVKGNPAAMNGLKRSFADMMMNETAIVKRVAGEPVVSDAKMKAFWSKYEPAMQLIYSKDEMQALKNVRKLFEMENRQGRSITGIDGSQTAANNYKERALEKLSPVLDWTGRAVRFAINSLASNKAEAAEQFVLRAQYDPAFAKELEAVANVGRKQGKKAMQREMDKLISRISAYTLRSYSETHKTD